ncbi:MAG: UDP-N-acetylmuramoyl-tripeptide--D-alanyl-D-alanine ligase [Planctomycetota bacterium]|jgi:UDP-N-acetylmuramoyl-tripeptide--D-alanyl-D-alanine ligase
MKKISISDLADIIKAHPESDAPDTSYFTGVSTDSRTIKAGDCFFAIAGENFDGHNYVTDAFAKGTACAVVSKDNKFAGDCVLSVDDTIKALGDLAREYRRRMNFKVIAITGSVGKTTTRQIIYHVLNQHFRVFQSPGNFNNNIGLPLTLLGAEPDTQIIIAELGSNFPGEIDYLTRIAQPDIAIVTNVYSAHLAGFGDLKTIIREKLSISQGLRRNGLFIINADFNELVEHCRAEAIEFTTFGSSKRSDVRAQNITCTGPTGKFTIEDNEITVPLPGRGNVENTLAAWAVCSRLGISIDDFVHDLKGLAESPGIPMRAQLMQIETLTVLNDCYNANPASMENALQILATVDPSEKRRRVFICGDMAELGRQSEHLHAELGTHIAQAKVRLLLAVGKFASIAADSAKSTAEYNLQTKCFKDTLSACNNLKEFIKDYDVILVKGSRASGLEAVIEKLNDLFSRTGVQAAKSEQRETG